MISFIFLQLRTLITEIDDIDVKVQLNNSQLIIGSDENFKSAFNTDLNFHFTIPETLNYEEEDYTITTIGDFAFYKTYINKIYIPKTVSVIKSTAFELCYQLKEIQVDPENPYFVSERNNLLSKDKTVLYHISYDIGQGEIPSSVISFSDSALSASPIKTFQYLPKYKHLGEALFCGCRKLKKVSLSRSKLTEIPNRMFKNCYKLKLIEFPNTITKIGEKSFKSTPLLHLPNPDKITFLGRAALQNTSLTKVNLFVANITSLSEKLFKDCIKLESINLPDALERIEPTTFSGCESLDTVIYRGTTQFNQTNIFNDIFPKVFIYESRYPWKKFGNIKVIPITSDTDPRNHYKKAHLGMRMGMGL